MPAAPVWGVFAKPSQPTVTLTSTYVCLQAEAAAAAAPAGVTATGGKKAA